MLPSEDCGIFCDSAHKYFCTDATSTYFSVNEAHYNLMGINAVRHSLVVTSG